MPAGLVTFLFTDVEGSTRSFHLFRDQFVAVLNSHRAAIRGAIAEHGGFEIKADGDGFFIVFAEAAAALRACASAQFALEAVCWPDGSPVRVRMGLHSGEAVPGDDGDYLEVAVHQAARIADAAHGGQVLVSAVTAQQAGPDLPGDIGLLDRGPFILKDFDVPQHLFQLTHPRLASAFPALRASPAQSHNLPDTRTSFVGRRDELEHVASLVQRQRLVCIVGPGGAGKTRLAVELGARLAPTFDAGVRLCDLSPLKDAGLVPAAIGDACGVRADPGADPLEAVADDLAGRSRLLLLDNCEHLLDAAGTAAQTLLNRAPGLRIMATSREQLGLSGEQVWRVHPLTVADPAADLAVIRSSAAARLFRDRARLADPEFEVTEENAADVAVICQRLDGLPLGIELVAARVGALPLSAIAGRLTDQLLRAPGGERGRPDRHRTLEATIGRSYELLSPAEQELLRRLSIFPGSFLLDAAEAVGPADGSTLEMLADLVSKSLVIRDPDAQRYRLLETIRSYGRRALHQVGEADDSARNLLLWCTAFAEAIEEQLRAADQPAAFEAVHREVDNLRAALGWAVANRSPEGLRLVGALTYYWLHRGNATEGRAWAERLLAAIPDAEPAALGKAHHAAGIAAYRLSDFDSCRAEMESAVGLLRTAGESSALARAMLTRAASNFLAGDVDLSRTQHIELGELAQRIGDVEMAATALTNLGEMARVTGDSRLALHYAERAMVTLEQGQASPTGRLHTTVSLAQALAETSGPQTRVTGYLEYALDLAVKGGSPMATAWAINGVAGILARSDPAAAARVLGASASLGRGYGFLDPGEAADREQLRSKLADELGADRVATLMAGIGNVTMAEAIDLARRALAALGTRAADE
ncbi:MAG: adenylate/guanylate cyclase domain-containing protein [Jatrophihabitans sp.]|uniref:adenylate/guanylate cyclase domain-containing protein n=1 Tax=Jatrophihabitans sp. TaxID=1932789 RepID=UPI0039103129